MREKTANDIVKLFFAHCNKVENAVHYQRYVFIHDYSQCISPCTALRHHNTFLDNLFLSSNQQIIRKSEKVT